jgi:glycosyltransferase involved in cell wall biosynthesis
MGLENIERKITILIIANEIYPDDHGGVHTYIYEIAKGLKNLGHNVCILTKKTSAESKDIENLEGINIYRYKVKQRSFGFLYQIDLMLSVRKAFEEIASMYKFDLVNLNSPHVSFGVSLSRKAKKIPKIYTFHALLAEEESSSVSYGLYKWYSWRKYIKPIWFSVYLLFSRWLEKKALNDSEKIISLSEFTSRCLTEVHRINTTKIAKIPAGVNTEKFKPSSDKEAVYNALGLPKDELILFTVRRLVPRMGLDNLIKAMPAVLKKIPNVFLVIGGQGPLYPQLKFLIEALKLEERVILTGFIPDEKLPLYYQASDLFVLPSKLLEGFGIVTLEALASGVPVLATPVGGSIEILSKLDKELIFKDISSESIASLLIQYLAEGEKRVNLQHKCRKFVLENYSWDKVMRQIEKLFLEVYSRESGL